MAKPLGIALFGCGTVGTGVAKVLLEKSDRIADRAGRAIEVRRIVVRDAAKPRDPIIPRHLLSTDSVAALHDPDIDVVVELIGGTEAAKEIVLGALAAGKHVVTANKALLARYGSEIFAAARKTGKTVCFEAAVGGGVPIIRAMTESLAANRISGIQGILNGTSNFILTEMSEKGSSYENAVKEAQRLGYAEADPTLDVDGTDTAHKLAILAHIAFGVVADPDSVDKVGIQHVDAMDIRFAEELGYSIKLLAEAWTDDRKVALHVAPVLVRHTDMLSRVRGAANAVQTVGDLVGETLYHGPGAGMDATASSVLADLIDLAVGRAQLTFAAAKLWSGAERGYGLSPAEVVKSRFYLRMLVHDQPGTIAEIARVLADQDVSITSVILHEAVEHQESRWVPLVILTHTTATARIRAAIAGIDRLTCVSAGAVYFSVDD